MRRPTARRTARSRRPRAAQGQRPRHVLRQDRSAQGHLARGRTRARSSRSSARTAPASRRRSRRSRASSRPRRARSSSTGETIAGHAAHTRSTAKGIVQVPEGRRIFSRMTVRRTSRWARSCARTRSGIKADARPRLRALPAPEGAHRTRRAARSPGGEQQMLAMGRGLMAKPKLLMLDEPSMGLAPVVVETIFEIIAEAQQGGHHDPARRAERAHGAVDRRPRLRARDRRDQAHRHGQGTARRTRRSARPTSASRRTSGDETLAAERTRN